jgi:hypothetical protein
MAAALVASGAGELVGDAGGLARSWRALVEDGAERGRRVAIGRQMLDAHRGALERTVDLVRDILLRGADPSR